MKYEYKYLTGDMYYKAAKLFEENPEVMTAYGKECGRAQMKGYQAGEGIVTAAILLGAALAGGTVVLVKKIKNRKNTKKPKNKMPKYIEI